MEEYLLDYQERSIAKMKRYELCSFAEIVDENVHVRQITDFERYYTLFDKHTTIHRCGLLANKPGTGKTRIVVNHIYNMIQHEKDNVIDWRADVISVPHYVTGEYNPIVINGLLPECNEYQLITMQPTYITDVKLLYYKGKFHTENSYNYVKSNATLIICANNLVEQWVNEFALMQSHKPDKLKVYAIKPRKVETTVQLLEALTSNDIVIAPITLLKARIIEGMRFAFARVIIDEPSQSVKISTRYVFGRFTWLVCATDVSKYLPQNPTMTNVYKYMPKIIEASIPMNYNITEHTLYYEPNTVVNTLKDFIDEPDIKEYLIAGDIHTATSVLSDKYGINSNSLIDILKSYYIKRINVLTKYTTQQFEVESESFKKNKAEKLKLIEALERRLVILSDLVDEIKDSSCSMCYDHINDIEVPMVTSCCQIILCKQCIINLSKHTNNISKCIHCRIDGIKYIPLVSDTFNKNESDRESIVLNLVRENINEHIVLYMTVSATNVSNNHDAFIRNLNNLADVFELKGDCNMQKNIIKEFKEPLSTKPKVLILREHRYAAGLNLQHSNKLIIWNETTPDIKTQVIGRLKRLGRTNPNFDVYNLLSTY